MVEQCVIGVLLSNFVIGVNYSRRSADITVTTSHRADLGGLQMSLQHQDKYDFCQLFLIESTFANNFAIAVINIKFPKQHSVL
jgi:hypothetical protein